MADRDDDPPERPQDAKRREAMGLPAENTTGDGPDPIDEGRTAAIDVPPAIDAVGRIGVHLALGSLVLAAFGIGGTYLGVQPYGTVAIALSLAGVTLAMGLGIAFQAYAGDYLPDR